ncbi:cytochrome P450 [Streptomyces sp. HUAS ZL42]|uniref:cytochrome P450 n=1 Tax=Streptomyces sp. HUAS ZL42 TaxID=3231715 RepID=UPI00345E7F37
MAASSDVPDTATAYTAVTAPGAWPLLGHAPRLMRDPLGFLTGLPAHGDIVDITIGAMRVSVVCHPELVHQMLLSDKDFDKGGPFFERVRAFTGNGVGTCPRADHRRQRRLVQPAFHPARFPGYAEVMVEQTVRETADWADGHILDVRRAMARLTSRVLTQCLFSTRESDTTTSEFIDSVDELMSLMIPRMLTPVALDWIPLRSKRRFAQASRRVRALSARIIADRRQAGTDRGDALSALLAARDEDGSALSDDELVDQITTLYIAGAETSANLLAWVFHILAGHPDVEQRLHTEVDTVLGARAATADDLPRLAYTRQIIDETLRKYPIGWVFTRAATTDTTLGGCRIPAGRTIVYSPYMVHHQPGAHPEPERFDPDRWAGRPRPARGTYIPFSEGARKCMGDTFALTEATLALSTIAAGWKMKPVSHRPIRPRIRISLVPNSPLLRLERRHGTHH